MPAKALIASRCNPSCRDLHVSTSRRPGSHKRTFLVLGFAEDLTGEFSVGGAHARLLLDMRVQRLCAVFDSGLVLARVPELSGCSPDPSAHAGVGENSRTAVSRERCERGNVIMGSWARRSRDSSMRSASVVTVSRNPAAVGCRGHGRYTTGSGSTSTGVRGGCAAARWMPSRPDGS